MLDRTQLLALLRRPFPNRGLNNNLYLAEKAMNVGEIVCSLSDFDDGHNVGQSFAWSHV